MKNVNGEDLFVRSTTYDAMTCTRRERVLTRSPIIHTPSDGVCRYKHFPRHSKHPSSFSCFSHTDIMPPSKRSKRAVSGEDSDEVRTYPQLVSDGRMCSTPVKPDNEPQPQFHKNPHIVQCHPHCVHTPRINSKRKGLALKRGLKIMDYHIFDEIADG